MFTAPAVLDQHLAVVAYPGRCGHLGLLARIDEFELQIRLGQAVRLDEIGDLLANVAGHRILLGGVSRDGHRPLHLLEDTGRGFGQGMPLVVGCIPLRLQVPGEEQDENGDGHQQNGESTVLQDDLQSKFLGQVHARRRSASKRRIESRRKVAVKTRKKIVSLSAMTPLPKLS